MIGIKISNNSDKPIYQQLFEQISSQILGGKLAGGYNLPPIRTAAKELRISIITVKKAWEELERFGLINSVVGKGCFVSELTSDKLIQKRNALIEQQFKVDIQFYKTLGVSRSEALDYIQKYY